MVFNPVLYDFLIWFVVPKLDEVEMQSVSCQKLWSIICLKMKN